MKWTCVCFLRIAKAFFFCYALSGIFRAGVMERMAAAQQIVIPVRLGEKQFRRFARFDMLRLRKRWVRPAVFALILCAFAFVALFSRLPQSGMIAAVLLAVGLGLPIVYIGMFLSQVNVQAQKWKLGKEGRPVYTVTLGPRDFSVVNNQKAGEAVTVPWSEAGQAYRMPGCIYLYASAAKAYLLPDGQANVSDEEVWNWIVQGMGKEKCRVSAMLKKRGRSK